MTEVEAAVRHYWDCSTSKHAQNQQDCYSEDAQIFATSSQRLEPGRLVHLRREREYLSAQSSMRAQLGPIEVQPIGTAGAVAAYTLQFHSDRKLAGTMTGRPAEEHLLNARVTHVFVRGANGSLKIVHEHISIPDNQADGSGRHRQQS
ncbi:MAG TPA: nuclear transport factor 2 family protein [Candidatus Saccharimonadales bacterium]|nr:nuclear transport factor 2 family protein [Candidatus Saccharimonadales bacterium]